MERQAYVSQCKPHKRKLSSSYDNKSQHICPSPCHSNDKAATRDTRNFTDINFRQKGGTPSCTSEDVQNIPDSLKSALTKACFEQLSESSRSPRAELNGALTHSTPLVSPHSGSGRCDWCIDTWTDWILPSYGSNTGHKSGTIFDVFPFNYRKVKSQKKSNILFLENLYEDIKRIMMELWFYFFIQIDLIWMMVLRFIQNQINFLLWRGFLVLFYGRGGLSLE